jgi:N-acetylmuramoyl-L-alanine amidase
MRGPIRRLIGSVVVTTGIACVVNAATIDAARVRSNAGNPPRIEIDVSSRVAFTVSTLENPHCIVVDLDDAKPRSSLDVANTPTGSRDVTQLRGSQRADGYRIVVDVAERLQPDAYMITAPDSRGDRLIIELKNGPARSGPIVSKQNVAPTSTAVATIAPSTVRTTSKTPSVAATKSNAPQAPAPSPKRDASVQGRGLRDFIVAIDAGHGGDDPGATGVGKIQEKNVALAIAKELARLVNAESGYRGDLTRTGDYYLTLRQRTNVARNRRADLFVSIHADMFSRADAAGASVYTLSAKGATNETARWLAEKENASDLIGGAGDVSLDDKNALLAHVLLDLSMDANRSASIEAGTAVLTALNGFTQLHREHVEQAGFVVLKSPDIPSILVETGYLSNPREARNLAQTAYQRKIAQAIFRGITTFAQRHPPPGTALAERQQKQSATRQQSNARADLADDLAAR